MRVTSIRFLVLVLALGGPGWAEAQLSQNYPVLNGDVQPAQVIFQTPTGAVDLGTPLDDLISAESMQGEVLEDVPDVPDAPSPALPTPTHPRFFQFRPGPDAPPFPNPTLRHGWEFWAQAGFMFSMEELARTRTGATSERVAASGVLGLSYLGYRFFSPCFSLGMAAAGGSWLHEWVGAK